MRNNLNPASFLLDATRSDDKSSGENRLSRIFVACFNADTAFRKATCVFLDLRHSISMRAVAEIHTRSSRERGRVDIVIQDNNRAGRNYAIENKLGAPLTPRQLSQYEGSRTPKGNRLAFRKVVAMVRDRPREAALNPKRYKIYRWADFHGLLTTQIRRRGGPQQADSFVMSAFANYLVETKVANGVDIIPRARMNRAVQLMRIIRFDGTKSCPDASDSFATLSDFGMILNELIVAASKKSRITRAIGRNFRSRCWLSHWYPDYELRNHRLPTLGVYLDFEKPRRQLTCIFCELRVREHGWEIGIGAWKRDKRYMDKYERKIFSGRSDISKSELITKCIKHWEEWLYRSS